jgi:hypothetical protein
MGFPTCGRELNPKSAAPFFSFVFGGLPRGSRQVPLFDPNYCQRTP